MAGTADKWYFTEEQLEDTPSRKCGYDKHKELTYRQQTANFIQEMGQKLKVSQLCINTAIVYMHRFYVFHSFTHFAWRQMAAAALFLAAKVEEQPRKLEHVIKVAHMCRNNKDNNKDIEHLTSERYKALSQDLVFNENVLLQTLGFDVAIDHPHTHVVRCCHLVRASKDLAQSSYFLASNSLHVTTMCLQYKPTVVACFCIHVACKWSMWEIPLSSEKKEWFLYVDPTVTTELLQQLMTEFLSILETCPTRLKEKIMSMGDTGMPHFNNPHSTNSPFDTDPKKITMPDQSHAKAHSSTWGDRKPIANGCREDPHKHRSGGSSSQQQREREYREKKEREKLAAAAGGAPPHPHKAPPPKQGGVAHGHHRPAPDPKLKPPHQRPPQPRDILREAAARDSPFGIATKDYNAAMHKSDNKDIANKQRDYLLKPNVAEPNNYANYNGEKAARPQPPKAPTKHEPRRHEVKAESDAKRPHSAPGHDRNNSAYKPMNSTSQQSQQIKSPFTDASKSVLKGATVPPPKQQHHHNGNNYGQSTKDEAKEEPMLMPMKKPSLFSPEKSPPSAKLPDSAPKRVRNYSSGSEPELRPVMKKIDQVEGFENLMRVPRIGINKLHQIPDIITPITDVKAEPHLSFSKDMKPPDIIPPLVSESLSQPIVNGIETNPVLISSLLKETPAVPHLSVNKNESGSSSNSDANHHHHKSKKKNKEKHKHKDKNREEKEKKKKHKEKDRDKHKHKEGVVTAEPIKIKIQKDKIQQLPPPSPLKIKIPKDVIKTEMGEAAAAQPPLGLKIKIPREKISNCAPEVERGAKKRERSATPGDGGPPGKVARPSSHRGEPKPQNGRHSYNKVSTYDNSSAHAQPYHNMAMYPPPPPPQNMFYYPMGVVPPQPYGYPDPAGMYNYYNGGYGYEMYQMPQEPPLPMDAPPDIPPPPPPEANH